VIITGNSVARPWITSDPPMEVQDLDIVNYPFTIDASEITGAGSGHTFTLQVTGNLIAGTVVNVTPIVQNGPGSTLYSGTLVIDPPPAGFGSENLDLGIVVTDTTATPNSAAIQPLLIRILSLTGSH